MAPSFHISNFGYELRDVKLGSRYPMRVRCLFSSSCRRRLFLKSWFSNSMVPKKFSTNFQVQENLCSGKDKIKTRKESMSTTKRAVRAAEESLAPAVQTRTKIRYCM